MSGERPAVMRIGSAGGGPLIPPTERNDDFCMETIFVEEEVLTAAGAVLILPDSYGGLSSVG